MIRVLLGSALPILGLGVAAAVMGPDLVAGPRGEPLIMAAPDEASLYAATFDGEACPSALLFANPSDTRDAAGLAGTRVVVFTLRSEADLEVEDFPGGTEALETVLLVFDDAGRLIAAANAAALHPQAAARVDGDCAGTPETTPRAPI